jgi:glyoxylase-like metal-dependent hydrolase (beta-lactamase superfamily II)
VLLVPGLHVGERTLGGRVYLLDDGLTCVLIDTGAPDGTLGAGELIERAGHQPHHVRLILLTHGHRGHAGNAAGLRELTHAPLAATAPTAAMLAAPPAPRAGLARLVYGRSSLVDEAVRVDRVVEPGDLIDLAGGIEVIGAPGHAPGAVAFHLRGPSALCLGDAASVTANGLVAPPRRRCENPDEAARSAASLSTHEVRVLAPGHGFPMVDGRLPVKRRG